MLPPRTPRASKVAAEVRIADDAAAAATRGAAAPAKRRASSSPSTSSESTRENRAPPAKKCARAQALPPPTTKWDDAYKRLRKKSKKLIVETESQWKPREAPLPQSAENGGAKKSLILCRLRREGTCAYARWDARAASAAKTDWPVDYIVGCGERAIEAPLPENLLVKYSNYPVACWTSCVEPEGDLAKLFWLRVVDCDLIELNLRRRLGDTEFERAYPGRYLEPEQGAGGGRYVTAEASLYKNELMAIEHEWNLTNQAAGLPDIIIEDWLGDFKGVEEIRNFEFTSALTFSPRARAFLAAHGGLVAECGCGCSSSGRGRSLTCRDYSRACTAACGCALHACSGRAIEVGRRVRLCVFREPGRGWGVRALEEIRQGDFVSEFLGRLNLAPSGNGDKVFDFTMRDKIPRGEGRRPIRFTLAAARTGNEGRFFNHSCEPNIRPESVLWERHYLNYFSRKCFYATRNIEAGEELLFNYFPYGLAKNVKNPFFDVCRCGSKRCFLS